MPLPPVKNAMVLAYYLLFLSLSTSIAGVAARPSQESPPKTEEEKKKEWEDTKVFLETFCGIVGATVVFSIFLCCCIACGHRSDKRKQMRIERGHERRMNASRESASNTQATTDSAFSKFWRKCKFWQRRSDNGESTSDAQAATDGTRLHAIYSWWHWIWRRGNNSQASTADAEAATDDTPLREMNSRWRRRRETERDVLPPYKSIASSSETLNSPLLDSAAPMDQVATIMVDTQTGAILPSEPAPAYKRQR
ncbi:hypothetical protein Dda_7551 [Drechslerella dactyloides]|uniref:Uncharacterized protein n=1 Tax=Drechslerella dactyloides TaxID=74499 RepID=A0AAD6ISS5_DREDA|nr:hypothetical protein Dda_7551 [Drechslerella dactyloides]